MTLEQISDVSQAVAARQRQLYLRRPTLSPVAERYADLPEMDARLGGAKTQLARAARGL